jgi:mevalonate kinase
VDDFLGRITARAPGVIKLFGEHAVVYGKPAVGATVNMYSTSLTDHNEGSFHITLEGLNVEAEIPNSVLADLYFRRTKADSIDEFVKNSDKVNSILLPLATIAGNVFHQFGKQIDARTTINSTIPMQKGYASSAAISVCFAVGLTKFLKVKMTDSEMVNLAREGERIFHKSEGAGIIDVNVSYHGGCVGYSREEGVKVLKMGPEMKTVDILLVDTGPKKSTAETVGWVAELMKKRKKETQRIIDDIGELSLRGVDALRAGNMEEVGQLMFLNQERLKMLGVSSDGLDRAVEIARKSGALGAKLSGGGRGGLAIVLTDKKKSSIVSEDLIKAGFDVFVSEIVNKGAKEEVTVYP